MVTQEMIIQMRENYCKGLAKDEYIELSERDVFIKVANDILKDLLYNTNDNDNLPA